VDSAHNPLIDAQSLQPHKLLALYHTMVMARALERRVWWLNRTAQTGAVFNSGGSEAVQVAAAAILRPGTDWVVPHSRDLALCLALGVTPLDVMLSVFGRSEDQASAGRMTPVSFSSRRARILSVSSTGAAQVAHAAGIAYASRVQGLDELTLVSIGGAAVSAGDWHEGLNFAAVHRLPLICLVQDEADLTAPPLEQPGSDLLVRRAHGYGVAGGVIDGADFNAAFESVSQAAQRARSGGGPTILHARISPLTALTPSGSFQPREQLEEAGRRDPIETMRRDLESLLLLDPPTDAHIQRDCQAVAEAAVEQALASAPPKPAAALDNVFEELR
jgi:2-oxoisovalerate dehydrogenase E1 component alpha subunit